MTVIQLYSSTRTIKLAYSCILQNSFNYIVQKTSYQCPLKQLYSASLEFFSQRKCISSRKYEFGPPCGPKYVF